VGVGPAAVLGALLSGLVCAAAALAPESRFAAALERLKASRYQQQHDGEEQRRQRWQQQQQQERQQRRPRPATAPSASSPLHARLPRAPAVSFSSSSPLASASSSFTHVRARVDTRLDPKYIMPAARRREQQQRRRQRALVGAPHLLQLPPPPPPPRRPAFAAAVAAPRRASLPVALPLDVLPLLHPRPSLLWCPPSLLDARAMLARPGGAGADRLLLRFSIDAGAA